MSKLSIKTLREDHVASIREVSIPISPVTAIMLTQSIQHLREYEDRALKRLNTKRRDAEHTGIECRVEGDKLVVRIVQGMFG